MVRGILADALGDNANNWLSCIDAAEFKICVDDKGILSIEVSPEGCESKISKIFTLADISGQEIIFHGIGIDMITPQKAIITNYASKATPPQAAGH
jgi:hypothetical protein